MTRIVAGVVALLVMLAGLQCTDRSVVKFDLPEPKTPIETWLLVRHTRTYYDETLSITFDTVLSDERCCTISDSCSGLAMMGLRISTTPRDTVSLNMIAWVCPQIDDCGPYNTIHTPGYSITLLEMSSLCSGGHRLPYGTYNMRVWIVPDSYGDGS